MHIWRLLDTKALTAAENMALDDALLEAKGNGESPNTIRFLQFSPRAVLVGYHQSIQEEVRTDYCRAGGIDINRRITGGGGLLFDESQLGWEVICDKSFFNVTLPGGRLFRSLCEPVITALDMLGVKASFRPRNDIEINGRKISGTGGTESYGAFLFQGTMLIDFDIDTMLRSLRIPIEKLKAKEIDSVRERVTCLKWELGETPPLDVVKDSVRKGFERHLGIRLVESGLTPSEKRLFSEKIDYYRSSAWIDRVKPEFEKRDVVQGACKAEGGLVRFTLVVNLKRRRLKEVYITGDFLSFPSRALFDLEAELRGSPLDTDLIRDVIRSFFEKGRIAIPGMDAGHFLRAVEHALGKIEMTRWGIPLEYCNMISLTNGSFEQIIRMKPSVLLLPYCAKLPDCELKHAKGCAACGGCSVGSALDIGRARKMKTVCITNFEDLMGELDKMKAQGTSAFIGCCCQPFFIKHMEDFAKSGVPGILLDIDNTTCYELDQARQAYAGRFMNQTELNLDLLRSVLDAKVA